MVIMVITGGKGTLAGPIVGGVIFGFMPVIVRSFAAPAVQWILYGALMIVIVFRPAAGNRARDRALGGELEAASRDR
jgi:ABC-type branched-subunit amino acid transport system permease subunit